MGSMRLRLQLRAYGCGVALVLWDRVGQPLAGLRRITIRCSRVFRMLAITSESFQTRKTEDNVIFDGLYCLWMRYGRHDLND